MRTIYKASLVSAALFASTMAMSSHASEVGLSYYDFRGTGILAHGKLDFNNDLAGTLQIGETNISMVRVGLNYKSNLRLADNPMHFVGGYSSYDSTSGVWFGAGISHGFSRELSSTAELIHDTAGRGFMRLNFGLDYALSNQASITGGYSVNTNSVSNEFRIGMAYRF